MSRCLASECAWSSCAIRAHAVPGQDQHFLDLVPDWASVFHWESRSSAPGAQPKVLPRLFGAYASTRSSERSGLHLTRPDGPLVQLSHQGLTLAGQPIQATWTSPWTISWSAAPLERAPLIWNEGEITFRPDRHTATARVCGAVGHPERWALHRSRLVGGPGAISLFSFKRKQLACPQAARSLPFSPTNRQSYSLPLRSSMATPRPDKVVASGWEEVFRAGRYQKVLVSYPMASLHKHPARSHTGKHLCISGDLSWPSFGHTTVCY